MLRALAGLLVVGAAGGGFYAYTRDEAPVPPVVPEIAVVEEPDTSFRLEERLVTFEDGSTTTLRLADDFEIAVAAEGFGTARFMAKSPDGRVFVVDMDDYNLSRQGVVAIMGDWDPQTHRFNSRETYLENLRGANSIAFYTDKEGQTWLYVALTEHLIRYPYEEGDTKPSGEREIVTTFPNAQSPNADGVVWHVSRTILFVDDTLYVSVGSGCNLCIQAEGEKRAMILAMNPDGSDVRVYADGVKNAVGIEWAEGALYATENGVDHLGDEAPNDVLYKIEEGKHYGWPYCFELSGVKKAETSAAVQPLAMDCEDAGTSFVSFEAHTGPLGVTYFNEGHPLLKGFLFVAQQGSWEPRIGKGYQVLRVGLDGTQEVFLTGFIQDGERTGRPVHVMQFDENSFLLTEDFGSRMYYVYARE